MCKLYELYKLYYSFELCELCKSYELSTWIKSLEMTWIVLNIIIHFTVFNSIYFECIRMENPNYKNENIERKYLKNLQKNQFLKLKNILLEL